MLFYSKITVSKSILFYNIFTVLNVDNSECGERNGPCIHLPVNSGTHDTAIK